MPSGTTPAVIIIGGGIWGLSAAFHLARSGRAGHIIVLERNAELADETTRQAAGQIGQLRSHPVMARAVGYTLALLSDFEAETGHDPGIKTPGSLHLALCDERMQAFEAQVSTANAQGITLEFASSALIEKLAPAINQSEIKGAMYVHGDGYVDARQAALAYAAAARDMGVEIKLSTNVTGFTYEGDSIAGVQIENETLEADHVVITAGPWASLVAEFAGVVPPVHGIRLQQARTVVDPDMPAHHPVVRIPDRNCYLRPERGGYLYGYFDSEPTALDPRDQRTGFRTCDIEPPVALIDEARRLLSPIMPILGKLAISEYRQGMVSCTPDGWYVVGPIKGRQGLWLATACAAMGIAGSGAVGRWLSNWIVDGDPGDDLSMMDPSRFGSRANDRKWIRQQCQLTCANYYSLTGGATYSVGATAK